MRLIYIIMLLVGLNASALDKDEQKGLDDTVKLLKSSQDRQKAVDSNPAAKDIDDKATALTGNKENKEELYGVSADVFEKIVKEANGDPTKLQQMMNDASKNPEAFYNKYFDASQKNKVRDLATKIEKDQPQLNHK